MIAGVSQIELMKQLRSGNPFGAAQIPCMTIAAAVSVRSSRRPSLGNASCALPSRPGPAAVLEALPSQSVAPVAVAALARLYFELWALRTSKNRPRTHASELLQAEGCPARSVPQTETQPVRELSFNGKTNYTGA